MSPYATRPLALVLRSVERDTVRFTVCCLHGESSAVVRPDGLPLDAADVRDGLELRHRDVTACRCAVFEMREGGSS